MATENSAEEIKANHPDLDFGDWSDEAIQTWASFYNGDEPEELTSKGVFLFDPTRKDREVTQWTMPELVLGAAGLLHGVNKKTSSAAMKTLREQMDDIPEAWSNAECAVFLEKGVIPEMTSYADVYVNDRTRGTRGADSWSGDELAAWLHGEIKNTGRASDASLANAAVEAFGLESDPSDLKALRKEFKAYEEKMAASEVAEEEVVAEEEIVEATSEEAAPAEEPTVEEAPVVASASGINELVLQVIADGVDQYAETVRVRKPITPKEGGAAQRLLNNTFRTVITMDPPMFSAGMDVLVSSVRKHIDTVFDLSYAFRFVEYTGMSQTQKEGHSQFLHFLILKAKKNKALLKQSSIADTLSGFSDLEAAKVEDYFKKV